MPKSQAEPTTTTWSKDQLRNIAEADDLHISPFREDGVTYCHAGYQTSCQHKEFVGGAQAPLLRVPLADGTLVATPGVPQALPGAARITPPSTASLGSPGARRWNT